MSQERTERLKLDSVFADMPVTTTAGEMHRLMIQIEELKAAQAEIDRLNAVINDLDAEVSELNEEISRYRWNEYEYGAKNAALDLIVDDLTAKVQERDETIKEWERRFGTRTNTAWNALDAAHKEVKRRTEQVKEIERLTSDNRTLSTQVGIRDRLLTEKNNLLDKKIHQIRKLKREIEQLEREARRSKEIIEGTDEQVNEQAEEIERLRSALEESNKFFGLINELTNDPRIDSFCIAGKAVGGAALKGAE